MPTLNQRLTPSQAGGMVEALEPAQHPSGFLREYRNGRTRLGRWQPRKGWLKANRTAMPWQWGRGFAYKDKQAVCHVVILGDNGKMYHTLGTNLLDWINGTITDLPFYQVVVNDAVVWDETYVPTFAAWGNDLYIAFGSMDGSWKNLRYNATLGQAFGVPLTRPLTNPTAADAGVGLIPACTRRYFVTFVDVSSSDVALESDEPDVVATSIIIPDLHQVLLSNLPVSTQTGRTIHRRIYASDDGTIFARLATITNNNPGVTYADNSPTVVGATYVRKQRVPVVRCVAVGPNALPIWANDEENGLPATLYIALDAANPEAIAPVPLDVGTHDDPITGLLSMRDGVFVGKLHSVHFLNKTCDTCERVVEGTGVVAWATMKNIGSRLLFLSQEGPATVDHSLQEEVRFIGINDAEFDLTETWSQVDPARLPFAHAIHHRAEQTIVWHVQRCSEAGKFNDTGIVWEYGKRTHMAPTGKLSIEDLLICGAFELPVPGASQDRPFGTFPYGFVGEMYEGKHGDGVDDWHIGFVSSALGNLVVIDETGIDMSGDGLQGVVLLVYEGTGSNVVKGTCGIPKALITGYNQASGGNRELVLSQAIPLDATSKYVLGGFPWALDIDGVDGGDADSRKTIIRETFHVKGG